MTNAQKLTTLKSILGIDDSSQDNLLNTYLDLSKQEILNWKYSLVGLPDTVTEVPAREETAQIMAVVAGFNIRGAENQSSHNENGINRTFVYSDMLKYIRNNVTPFAKVG